MIAALALLAAAAWGGAATGASRDSNLSESAGDTPQVDGAVLTADAHLGGALEPGEDDELFAEAGYSGTMYPAFSDLDQHRPSLTAGWAHWFASWVQLRLSPFAGLRLSPDDALGGWDTGADASLRFRVRPRLRLTLGGGYIHRAANDAAFAWDSARARASVSVGLWRSAELTVGYLLEVGDGTFYAAPLPAAALSTAARSGAPQQGSGRGPGGRYGLPVTTFGTDLVAYRAGRVAHSARASLMQELPAHFFAEAGFTFTAVRGDVQSYEANVASVEVGFQY